MSEHPPPLEPPKSTTGQSPTSRQYPPPTGPPFDPAVIATGHVQPPPISSDRVSAPTPGADLGYDPGTEHGRGSSIRPWWGLGDVALGVVAILAFLIVGTVIAVVWSLVDGFELADLGVVEPTDLPKEMIVIPTLFQQLAMFAWPFMVSRWKGAGPARDWGWAIKPSDLGVGIGVALMAVFAAGAVQAGLTALLQIGDDATATNTEILSQFEGSPWLIGLLFLVVIAAPFGEEVFFRGLILRSVQKRLGAAAGVAISTLLFVPLHIADGGIFSAGQIVLWAAILTLGVILGIAAVMTNRLAVPIVAHTLVNAFGAAAALGAFDSISPA